MFVDTEDGLLNVACIKLIKEGAKGEAIIKTMEGGTVRARRDYDYLASRLGPIIPESNGTRTLHMGYDRSEFYHYFQPVLGWTFTATGPEPILPSGDNGEYLVFADGSVEHTHMASYKSVEEAIDAFKTSAKI